MKNLFEEFPKAAFEAWQKRVVKELGGKEIESLNWKIDDEIKLQPIYTPEDLKQIEKIELNPKNEFSEGENDWIIYQKFLFKNNTKSVNQELIEALNNGLQGIHLVIEKDNISASEFEEIFDGVFLEYIHFTISAQNELQAFNEFSNYARIKNLPNQKLQGILSFDPLSKLAKSGNWKKSQANDMADWLSVFKEIHTDFPLFTNINIEAELYTNSGVDASYELAFTISQLNEYFQFLNITDVLTPKDLSQVSIKMGIGSDYFVEIAKIKALKMLWINLVKAWEKDIQLVGMPFILTESATINHSGLDHYNNILRLSSQAMSAALAGVNAISLSDYDEFRKEKNEHAKRISRNIQHVLKEEAYFNKVFSPASGSYYIENLSLQLAEKAWKVFQEIEDIGGFVAALKKGFIQKKIEDVASQKLNDFEAGKMNLIGVNKYPNTKDKADLLYKESKTNKSEKHFSKPIENIRWAKTSEENLGKKIKS